MSSSFDLPEDVVVKILYRLPVKSLIRFTCVSKRWLSIISDPKFGKSHFQLASQLRTLSRKVLLISYPRTNACYDAISRLRPRFQTLDDKFAVKNFTFPSEEHEEIEEMGSCNGLLLVGQPCRGGGYKKIKNLSLWNLSNGFFRKIPDPSFQVRQIESIDEGYLYFLSTGFGHVSASDDYKLVFVIPAHGDLLEVHIFSLRVNMWKVVTAPYSKWPDWDSEQGTFLNEAIHWVIGCKNVCAFDLVEEGFRQLPLPPVLFQNESDDILTKITTLVHLGGYLCIWSRNLYRPQQCEVWAMTVYGVPESWVKLFQIDLQDFPGVLYSRWSVCFVTENNTVLIRLPKELCWFECHDEEMPICTRRYWLEEVHPDVLASSFRFHATTYDETLLSVAE